MKLRTERVFRFTSCYLVIGYFKANKEKQYSGLTKREYFAVLAMQGILFNPPYGHIDCKRGEDLIDIVKLSVDYADELLKQLDNE